MPREEAFGRERLVVAAGGVEHHLNDALDVAVGGLQRTISRTFPGLASLAALLAALLPAPTLAQVEVETPLAGWKVGSLTDQSDQVAVAYPPALINRGAQKLKSRSPCHKRGGRMRVSEVEPVADQSLIDKIRSLPPEKVAEVEDFVDFLRMRDEDRLVTHAATKLSEDAFRQVWDNPCDAEYDRL